MYTLRNQVLQSAIMHSALLRRIYARGFVLVVVMLFLSILSLLALSVLEVSLLEYKMGASYQDKIQSFYIAEKYLSQAEEQILNSNDPTNANIKFTKIDSGVCGAIFYLLTATVDYHGAKSILRSTVTKIGDTSQCDPKSAGVVAGRQAFWIES